MKIDGLTPQQHRVGALVAIGKTDKEIATELGISKQGVRFHLRRIATRWKLSGNVRVLIANRMHRAPEKAA